MSFFRPYRVVTIVLVGVMVFAVLACGIAAGHAHDMMSGVGHVDHAYALTLALVPLVFAIASVFVAVVLRGDVFALNHTTSEMRVVRAHDPPPKIVRTFCSYAPRSPPNDMFFYSPLTNTSYGNDSLHAIIGDESALEPHTFHGDSGRIS